MFGATAVRQKRERERREKIARTLELQSSPYYIKPYGTRFDRRELPYFKYRETLKLKLVQGRHGNNGDIIITIFPST